MAATKVEEGLAESVFIITGAAGFIAYHLCEELLGRGFRVVGIDNLNTYYDVELKNARLKGLRSYSNFTFLLGDIANEDFLQGVFADIQPTHVVNFAAQAGVRYSSENPNAYIQSNLVGFHNILEACRRHPVTHLLYASSSSVYGGNTKVPFVETDQVGRPLSLYAATKAAGELMACSYSHLYGIPATGLRFFTVYGPFGRPDMAYFSFADRYFAGESIRVFNGGDFAHDLSRDFTYVDDVVEAVVRLISHPPLGGTPHEIYNIGNSKPEHLMAFIATLEACLGKALGKEVHFRMQFEPPILGDARATFASTDKLREAVGMELGTPLAVGLQRFADWYVDYFHSRQRGAQP